MAGLVYHPRRTDGVLARTLARHPAVMVNGPRACGKTTTAARHVDHIVRLDVPAQATPFRADADAALRELGPGRLLIDEWQEVPEVLGAVKRACDAGAPPGRFLLTGSVRAATVPNTWPGTGRVIDVEMGTMGVAETLGRLRTDDEPVTRLIVGGGLAAPTDPPDHAGYIDVALAGGFPEPALALDPQGRAEWYRSYVARVAERDVGEVLRRGDPDRIRAYLTAVALHTAQVVDHASVFRAAGIARRTAEGYEDVLGRLLLIARVPAWHTNRLQELVHTPKRFLADPALLAAAGRVGRAAILRDGHLLGALLENLVHHELRTALDALHPDVALRHLRTGGGRHEADLVLSLDARRVIGVGVKATAAPRRDDARHLIWMRDRLGDDFVRGVVFHTGPATVRLAERIEAIPIASLWS